MTNYELFQLEKFGDILPKHTAWWATEDVTSEIPELSDREQNYIFEQENPEA